MKNNFFIRLISGFCIGFGFIIPGVSGSAVAMSFNVYQDMIDSVSNLFKNFKKSFLYLLPIGLGIIISAISLYFPLIYLLKKNCFIIIMLFAGLLAGGLKPIIKKVEWKTIPKWNYLVFFFTFLLVIGLGTLSYIIKGNGVDLTNPTFINYLMVFISGLLFAISTVVPGVSGTALLLAVGYYYPIFDTLIGSFLSFSFGWQEILLLALFIVGFVVGVLAFSKLIKVCFAKKSDTTYMAISGFAIGSLPAMFLAQDWGKPKFNDVFIKLPMSSLTIIFGIVMLIGGFILAYLLLEYKEKKEKQKEEKDINDNTQG